MQLEGPVLLYGAGREAKSTRRFLAETAPDLEVFVTTDKDDASIKDATILPIADLPQAITDNQFKLIVRSAGVSIYKPTLVAARETGVKITTNINLWAQFQRGEAKVIAITGTKGKSTSAKLLHTMLTTAGFDAGLGGNIGLPPLDLNDHDWQVLELSSYQCSDLELQPDYCGVVSLYPEHLDWHEGEDNYYRDKLNLLTREKPVKYAMSAQASAHPKVKALDLTASTPLPLLPFSLSVKMAEAAARSALIGAHNLANSGVVARIALAIGVSEEAIVEGIARFEPLPHRLQEMRYGGRAFVNDSISTNPEATKAAMAAYPHGKVALAIGGFDRQQNYDDLIARLPGAPLSSLWFLPDTGHRIADALDLDALPYPAAKVTSLEELFDKIATTPEAFDALILSPGAPSYNQFNNFEERGLKFLELAKKHFG